MIQISNMSKIYRMGYNEVYALNNISIKIEKNEFVAIIGRRVQANQRL